MKKIWIIILLAVAVFAAYWAAYGINPIKKLFGSSTEENSGAQNKTPNSGSPETPTVGSVNGSFIPSSTVTQDKNGFPLMQGSKGKYVEMLQKALNDRYGSDLVVDGIFGTKTAKALSAHGFNPDAIYYKHFNQVLGYTYWS